jgi:2-keto-3-deoxy-L-rhamnonate aldolase RhmA
MKVYTSEVEMLRAQCRQWEKVCDSHLQLIKKLKKERQWVGLTDEETHEVIGTAGVDLLALAKQWADNEIHVYQFDNEARKIIKAVLRRAHGITKENT